MKVPHSKDIMLPLLQLMGDTQPYRISQMVDQLAQELVLEGENGQRETKLSRDQKALFYSRVVGARSYLAAAKLIENPKREVSTITERGLKMLKDNPGRIDLESLVQFPEFQQYLKSDSAIRSDPDVIDILSRLKEAEEQGLEGLAPSSDRNGTNGHTATAPQVVENNGSAKKDPIYDTIPHPSDKNKHSTKRNGQARRASSQSNRLRRSQTMQKNIEYVEDPFPYEESPSSRGPRRTRRTNNQAEAEKPSPITLFLLGASRYIENYYRNRWLYILPVIIMLLGYIASFFLLEDQFTSKGTLYVQSDTLIQQVSGSQTSDFGVWITPAQETAEELEELINTNSFLRLIIQQTELEEFMDDGVGAVDQTIAAVFDSLQVTHLGLNNVVVESTWSDRGIAVDLATATLNSFINWKITQDKKDSQAALEFLEVLAPQYEREFDEAVKELEAFYIQHPEPFRGSRPELEQLQIDLLNQKMSAADVRLQDATESLEQVRLEQVIAEGKTRQTFSIIDAPRIPVQPNGGLVQQLINLVVFLSVGVVILLLAVAATTLVDQTLKFPREASIHLGTKVLSVVKKEPKARRFGRRKKQEETAKA